MSIPPSGPTASGPKWSTKHQAPTVRRRAFGRARRTVIVPTWDSRASTTSTAGGVVALPGLRTGGVSCASTGPLMRRTLRRTFPGVAEREDGVERLRRWTDEQRGVPPAFGRMRASFDAVEQGSTTVRLPLEPELLLPDGAASGAVTAMLTDFGLASSVISSLPDLRGVTTVALTVDHLALPPTSGALVATCMAAPYV